MIDLNEGDIIMCKITGHDEYSYICEILESWDEKILGHLLFTDITRKKIRKKAHTILKIETMLPLKVAWIEENSIGFNRNELTTKEIEKCRENYRTYREIYGIIKTISIKTDMTVKELHKMIIEGLPTKNVMEEFEKMYETKAYGYPKKVSEELDETLSRKFSTKTYKFKNIIKLTCYTINGIDSIKESLKAGELIAKSKGYNVTIKLESVPYYMILMECDNKGEGEQRMDIIMREIENNIKKLGGEYLLKKNILV